MTLCATAAMAVSIGCADDVLRALSNTTDEFVQNAASKVDILWVVDNSNSMSQEQAGLGASFSAFIGELMGSGVDYHIGVISTDVADGGVLHTGVGSPPVIDNSITDPDAAKAAFLKNVTVGVNGSAQERGFEAAALALGKGIDQWNPGDPEPVEVPNPGFLRRGYCTADKTCEATTDVCNNDSDCEAAALFLIFVSDEDDKSFGPERYYWRLFESYQGYGNEAQVKISAIVGPAGEDGGCFNASRGSAAPGDRYVELVILSGGTSDTSGSAQGIFTSICEDFNESLTSLSINATGLSSQFVLDGRPNMSASMACDALPPQPMCVRVNGAAVPYAQDRNGWAYLSGNNAIDFGDNVRPPPGAKITVTYQGSRQ